MTHSTTTNLAQSAAGVEPAVLDQLVQGILACASPLRIVLFGSAARGPLTEHSDLDVLIVVPNDCDCREVARRIHRQLRGFPYAKDLVVVTQRDVDAHAGDPWLIIHTALAEGKELYHAAG